jgi:PAS domain S-box-containing protein
VKSTSEHYFLKGGGELGELTQQYDWASTSIGPVSGWSETLRAVVGIILHSQFPMFLWWGDEMIQFYNDAYRPSLGEDGKHPKALGQKGAECWPEIWETIYPLIVGVKTTGQSFFLEDRLIPIHRNGKLEDVYWTFSYSAVIGKDGDIEGVLVICNETTQKVLTTQQLAHFQQNFRNVVKQSPVAMCILVGPSHIVEVANDKMIELWGKPEREVLNRPIFEGLPDARQQGLEELLDAVYRTGIPFHANERPVNLIRFGKQQVVYQNFVYEPYRDSEGRVLGVLAISIDVTEQVISRHKIEDVVKERTESLRKSNDELSQFAYVASHDLQEPIRKISIFTEQLAQNLKGADERSKNLLQKIDSSASRMLLLIRDILELSQLSNHSEFLTVDLNNVLEETRAEQELSIDQQHARIESDKLPVIKAIPIQMSQLFGNLISNAIKFARPDEPLLLKITAEELSDDERATNSLKSNLKYVKLAFADNGIGFNEQYAGRIFEIFQRLHTKSQYQGTGIGLATCKKIAENHNGLIYAHSTLGKGAVFTVILPVNL